MSKNIKLLFLIAGASMLFSGCANSMQPQGIKRPQKVVIITKEKQKYILKDDNKIKHAVALLIIKVNQLQKKCKRNKTFKKVSVKTPYDKVILDFIKKK